VHAIEYNQPIIANTNISNSPTLNNVHNSSVINAINSTIENNDSTSADPNSLVTSPVTTINLEDTINTSNRCGGYSQRLVRCYRVDGLNGRIDFIVDLLKLVRWMSSSGGGMEGKGDLQLHITPAVRRCVSSARDYLNVTNLFYILCQILLFDFNYFILFFTL